jgi:hypothetical protein
MTFYEIIKFASIPFSMMTFFIAVSEDQANQDPSSWYHVEPAHEAGDHFHVPFPQAKNSSLEGPCPGKGEEELEW